MISSYVIVWKCFTAFQMHTDMLHVHVSGGDLSAFGSSGERIVIAYRGGKFHDVWFLPGHCSVNDHSVDAEFMFVMQCQESIYTSIENPVYFNAIRVCLVIGR